MSPPKMLTLLPLSPVALCILHDVGGGWGACARVWQLVSEPPFLSRPRAPLSTAIKKDTGQHSADAD